MTTVTVTASKGGIDEAAGGDFLTEATAQEFAEKMSEALKGIGATRIIVTMTTAGVTIDPEEVDGYVKAAAERIKRTFNQQP